MDEVREVEVRLTADEWWKLLGVLEAARQARIRPAAKILKTVSENSWTADESVASPDPEAAPEAPRHTGMRPKRGRRRSP